MDSPIGMYVTPNQAGSRNGANILMTWGTLASIGYDKYVQTTKAILNLRDNLVKDLKEIPELKILGNADLSVIAFDAANFNIYAISNRMKKMGWHLNNIQHVKGAHLCLTANHLKNPEFQKNFISDLKTSIAYVKDHLNDKPEGDGAVYASMAKMPAAIAPQLKKKLAREFAILNANIEETRSKRPFRKSAQH